MTTITEEHRKLVKKILKERLDAVKLVVDEKQGNLSTLNKAEYAATNQETLYNMDADQYEASLTTQLANAQDRKQKLKDFIDWLNEQTL